ncbi:MAG: Phosphoribosyl-AMP cyclohydrolase, partial [uncultured Corynebacteriales bacterium]
VRSRPPVRPRPRDRRPAQARRARPLPGRRAAVGHRRGAHGRLDGRRGTAPDADHRPVHVLVPVPLGVLGEGRHLRPPAVGPLGRARLRRRHRAGEGRPGRRGLPHRRPHLLRRGRPARGRRRPPGRRGPGRGSVGPGRGRGGRIRHRRVRRGQVRDRVADRRRVRGRPGCGHRVRRDRGRRHRRIRHSRIRHSRIRHSRVRRGRVRDRVADRRRVRGGPRRGRGGM